MEWTTIFSLIFGAGSIGYAIVTKILERRKYEQEVRNIQVDVDLKGDDFWKKRYDVLQNEVQGKDIWWKERYDTLYDEFQRERQLNNEIVKSFRSELREMRNDYEKQRELDKQKYEELLNQYRRFEEESQQQETEYKQRISQLEDLVSKYEKRLK